MFEPYSDLVQSHTLTLPSGEGISFDQSFWGKVIAVNVLHLAGGRYELDDYMATARLRQLLEAATVNGEWAFEPSDSRFRELRGEVYDLLAVIFGVDPSSGD